MMSVGLSLIFVGFNLFLVQPFFFQIKFVSFKFQAVSLSLELTGDRHRRIG